MSEPGRDLVEKYKCVDGKMLLVCDVCGYLFCGYPTEGQKDPYSGLIMHRCGSCSPYGGIK